MLQEVLQPGQRLYFCTNEIHRSSKKDLHCYNVLGTLEQKSEITG